ncbi:MAG: TolC family protein [Verrucomicrobia bacterium]|nr:TolC family protein [Verrucomicrobiota bacterium]
MKQKEILKLCGLAMVLAVVIYFASEPISAQETPKETAAGLPTATNQVTLAALVAEVLEKNPELNFYQAEIAATKGERRTAAAWANPEVSSTVGQKLVRSGGLSDEGVAWSVGVQQTFDWPGRIPLRKAIANRQMQLAELGFAQFKASLAARTRTLAYGVFAAQEKAAAAKEVADRFQQLREVLVQRDPAGLTPQLETRIIEATELTLQRKATEAALESQGALLELNQLRGQPWTNATKVEPVKLTFGKAPGPDDLLVAAQTNNFELQMRRVELEQQGFKVSLARKDGYPSLTAGPYYSQERAGDREQQVGIGVSLPLPLWNRNKGSVETAEARRKQAETSLFITQRDLDRRILERLLAYQTKLAEISKWRPESVDEFRQAAELADRHYRLGAVPIATYVELQKQYLEAVEALLDTRREALDAGQELQRLTGLNFNAGRVATPTEGKQ